VLAVDVALRGLLHALDQPPPVLLRCVLRKEADGRVVFIGQAAQQLQRVFGDPVKHFALLGEERQPSFCVK